MRDDEAPAAGDAPPERAPDATGEPPYPFQDLVGFRIADWSDGYARVELDVDGRHANRYGLPHGGVHATLMDTAAGFSGCWCPHPGRVRQAMTLSLTVSYLGRLRGSRMIAEARVTGGGRRSFFASVELTDELGTRIASALAVMRYRGGGGDPMGDPAPARAAPRDEAATADRTADRTGGAGRAGDRNGDRTGDRNRPQE